MLIRLVLVLVAKSVAWSSNAVAAKEITEECSYSLVQNRHLAQTRQAQTREDPQVCSLPVCVFHGPNAPRLWVTEHWDGAGHRLQNIVNGMAVAQKVGMNFGGVLAANVLTDQLLNFTHVATYFFGAATKDVGGLFAWTQGTDPGFDFSFENPKELEGQRKDISDGTNVWMAVAHEWYWNASVPASLFFPAEFRKRLAAPLASRPLLFTPSKTVVAMHLRRGDLHRDDPRATPNEYYYQLADRIRELLPSAEFHVFAAILDPDKFYFWKNEDFDEFRLKGMQVHVDDGVEDEQSVISTWAHLASADIFVGSQSSFSYIPMLLNCRCVISMGYTDTPHIDNWMNGREEWRDSYHSELTACVQRSQAPSQC